MSEEAPDNEYATENYSRVTFAEHLLAVGFGLRGLTSNNSSNIVYQKP